MKRFLKSAFAVAAVACTSLAPLAGAQAQYPERPIHVVVPWAAGGGTDSIARGFTEALKGVVGQPVVVDNIAGAGGMTGSIKVARGNPDGYTLLFNGTTDMTAALTFKEDLPLSLDDFTYIGGVYDSPTWVLSHKDRGYKTLKDFLAAARAKPGELTIGTGGPTGAQMLMAAAIKGVTGTDFRIIPYAGGAALRKALIGNQVDAGIIHAPVMLSEVKEGMMNVIGTGRPLDRITHEPLRRTPTLKDTDIPISVGITRGVMVPKDTPKEVVARLRELVEKAAKSEAFAQFGQKFGFEPQWTPGPEFEKQIKEELALFKNIRAKHIGR